MGIRQTRRGTSLAVDRSPLWMLIVNPARRPLIPRRIKVKGCGSHRRVYLEADLMGIVDGHPEWINSFLTQDRQAFRNKPVANGVVVVNPLAPVRAANLSRVVTDFAVRRLPVNAAEVRMAIGR